MSTWTSLLQKPASLRGSENLEEWFERNHPLGIHQRLCVGAAPLRPLDQPFQHAQRALSQMFAL